MKRRACLAAAGAVGTASLAGCLGDSTDSRPELEIDRTATGTDDDCVERELVDFERLVLPPKAAGLIGADSAVRWELALQAGEELYVRITNPDMAYLPHLRIDDPDGTAVVDERPVENIYTVVPEQSGRYAIIVSNPRWTESEEWFVDVEWYSAPECRR